MVKKIAVIAGAGPAGLTLAYELLTRTEIKPVIYEATNVIGGIAQTHNYKGNRIDIGGHRFFSKSERVMNWWFNFLPPENQSVYSTENDSTINDEVMLYRSRLSRIFYRSNFFPYPLSISLTVAWRLGLWNTFLIGLSYIKAKLFPIKDETFLDAFFINRFGYRLYQTFFKDYTEKVWGISCSNINANWGAQRIKGLSLRRAISHAVKDLISKDFYKAQKERETSLITHFYYPKYGPGQLWETVAEKVKELGGEIYFNQKITNIELNQNNEVDSVSVNYKLSGKTEKIFCNYFFSTMPIKDLINGFSPKAPDEVLEIANGLEYRSFISIGILLKKLSIKENSKKITEKVLDNWIYIQQGEVKVGRVQIFNNWSPHLVADSENTTWIGLEYFVDEGDKFWNTPDEELIKRGIYELEKINFIDPKDVLDACVIKMPKAYPSYWGSYENLDVVKKYTNSIPNLFLIGRNGMHRYNNQDHSMLTAMMAVDNIVEERKNKDNLWEVNLEMVYQEENYAE
jgi:protoporphyrinogen oxidase